MMTPPLPFVLSIPHAGLETPPEVAGRIALDETDLFNECDLWADRLFDFWAAPASGHSLRYQGVLATVDTQIARAIVDVNRSPDSLNDPDGVVKTRTSYGAEVYAKVPALAEREALRDHYWGDFHTRLQTALSEADGRVRLLLDCHNMAQTGPSHYDFPGKPRPLVCIANLGDRDGRPVNEPVTCSDAFLRRAGALAESLFADMTLLEPTDVTPPVVALNHPFRGGYNVRRHCRLTSPDHAGAPLALMVEINRGLIVGNQFARRPVRPPDEVRIEAIRSRLYAWAVALADLLEDAGA